MKTPVTQSRVHELLIYDDESGVLAWRINRKGKAKEGSIAGSKSQGGYQVVMVDNKPYKAHRLIWLYVYGAWPNGEIDHINGNPSDNRISNLRDVSHIVNTHNQHRPSTNSKSGLLGVSFNKGRWRAVIHRSGKQHFIGSFGSAHEAHSAYLAAKHAHHIDVPKSIMSRAESDRTNAIAGRGLT